LFVVDTNVLVYAANADSPFHAVSRERLDSWCNRPDAWFVTWGVLFEFLRVSTHRRVFRKPLSIKQAWSFVQDLLDSPGLAVLVPTERHAAVACRTLEELPHISGTLLHDAHTAILMREHGIRTIYTRDNEFRRFPFLDVVDPIEPTVHDSRARYRRRGTGRVRAGVR
jgi:hypothetical protein